MSNPVMLASYVSTSSTAKPPGTVYVNVRIPKTDGSGTYHPHPVNILVPDATTHSTATIVLHGGSGNNLNILRNLGLVRTKNANFMASDVAWGMMSPFGNCIVAAPQGWADPRTYSSNNPNGVASWDNFFMNAGALAAGWDDCQMLLDLRAYLVANWGVQGITLAGHSNGGMMVQRMMLQHDAFNHYISTSGPVPSYWATRSRPWPQKRYFATYGAQDDVINIVANGFQATQWNQTTATLSVADVNYPQLSSWMSEWSIITERGAAINPNGTNEFNYSDGVVSAVANGVQTDWTYDNNKLHLQLVSAAGHDIRSHQQATGRHLWGDWMKWVANS